MSGRETIALSATMAFSCLLSFHERPKVYVLKNMVRTRREIADEQRCYDKEHIDRFRIHLMVVFVCCVVITDLFFF